MTELGEVGRGHRWRALAFRRVVAGYLSGAGLLGLSIRDTSKPLRLSEAFAEDPSDIRGLSAWAVATQVDLKLDLPAAMRRAVFAADVTDKRWPCVIQSRKGVDDVAECFAVLRLADWVEVVKALEDAA